MIPNLIKGAILAAKTVPKLKKNIEQAIKLERNREKVGTGTIVPLTQATTGSAVVAGAPTVLKAIKNKNKKKQKKQKQSMTLDSAYSTKNKNYGETDLLK